MRVLSIALSRLVVEGRRRVRGQSQPKLSESLTAAPDSAPIKKQRDEGSPKYVQQMNSSNTHASTYKHCFLIAFPPAPPYRRHVQRVISQITTHHTCYFRRKCESAVNKTLSFSLYCLVRPRVLSGRAEKKYPCVCLLTRGHKDRMRPRLYKKENEERFIQEKNPLLWI